MGVFSSNVNDQNQSNLVNVNLSEADKAKMEKSKHKPQKGYAKLAEQEPISLQIVLQTKDKLLSSQKFTQPSQGVQSLPLFQIVASPGVFYKGEWNNGKQHGRGEVFTRNGVYFSGSFNHGVVECQDGILIFQDGSYYRGNFVANNCSGRGSFLYAPNGTKYVGNWTANHPEGQGVQTYPDGSVYKGLFSKGKKHGKGTFTWKNGKVFQGHFQNGQMNGDGTLSFPNKKSKFVGIFENGLKKSGTLQTEYGQYTGNFQFGQMHDKNGKFAWRDHKVYTGGFEFGKLHGSGKMIFPNGHIAVGVWQKGENIKLNQITPA